MLPDPAGILPHRPPFLFVSELAVAQPGVSATARWEVAVTGDEWFFAGHFPAGPPCPAS